MTSVTVTGSRRKDSIIVFHGRVAIVTGGGRGIGRSTAILLAQHGAAVAVLARTASQIDSVAQEITQAGGRACAVAGDIASYDGVKRAFAEVERDLGSCDILINNAAILTMGSVAASDPEAWARTIQINLLGPYYSVRFVLPGMLTRGWGRILNVSSAAGAGPRRPNGSAYSASKAALDRFTRSLSAEVEGTGVTCNAIYPGDTDTAMQTQIRETPADVLGEAELTFFRERHAKGELYDPAVPAKFIVAMLSQELNGEVINLDDPRGQAILRTYRP